jgi:hypothetical protein
MLVLYTSPTVCTSCKLQTCSLKKKLHNEDSHNCYSPPNIIIMIKSKRLKFIGKVARLQEIM